MLPRLEAILFSVTEVCHVGCRHCGFRGSRREREVEASELDAWVRQACEYGIGEVIFTGGEAFLRRDVLAAGVRVAAEYGREASVFTSSYWASSPAEARSALADLPGVTHLYLSSDVYHQERVPYAFVTNAIEAALELGITAVSICITYATADELEEVKAHYARFGDRLMFHADRVIPTQFLPSSVLSRQDKLVPVNPNRFSRSCYLGTPLVNPNGELNACHIGKAGAHASIKHLPYYLGSLREASLTTLMQHASRRPDYQFLRTHGPRGVAEVAAGSRKVLSVLPREEFTTGCDCCYSVLRCQEGRDALSEHVQKQEVRNSIDINLALRMAEEPLTELATAVGE